MLHGASYGVKVEAHRSAAHDCGHTHQDPGCGRHCRGEMATGELDKILFAVLALGLLTGVPLAVHFLRERMRKRDASAPDG